MGNKSKRSRSKDKVVDLPIEQQQGPVLDQQRFANKLQLKVAQLTVDGEAKDALIEQLWEENQTLKTQIEPLAERVATLEGKEESDGSKDGNE